MGVTQERLESGMLAAKRGPRDRRLHRGPVSRAELSAPGRACAPPSRGSAPRTSRSMRARVAALSGVRRVEGAAPVEPELNLSVPTPTQPPCEGRPALPAGTAPAVVLGDVDSGVDYGARRIRRSCRQTTRFIAIWDQSEIRRADAGRERHRNEGLRLGLDQRRHRREPRPRGGYQRPRHARDGHRRRRRQQQGGAISGVHLRRHGAARRFVMVKTNFQNTGVSTESTTSSAARTAIGQSAVVNLSLGSQFGPHDGTSAFEAGLSGHCAGRAGSSSSRRATTAAPLARPRSCGRGRDGRDHAREWIGVGPVVRDRRLLRIDETSTFASQLRTAT